MLVSNTDTTTSLSNETSLMTSLTASSNSSISPRTLKQEVTNVMRIRKIDLEQELKNASSGTGKLTAKVSNVSISVKENLTMKQTKKLSSTFSLEMKQNKAT